MKRKLPQRLESLDILRGFDLFFLVGLETAIHQLSHAVNTPEFQSFMWCFTHVDWEGFSPWDLVMPLFMFMSGITIPFALSHYKSKADKSQAYKRILKRVVLLWIFGMMCQGNLLALEPNRIYIYSNTLQAIATGYLVSSLLFLHTRIKTQIAVAALLLLSFWGAMEFLTIQGYGNGNYTPETNLAEWIEREVLGRFRDGASVVNGETVFSNGYRYTWILSSINFSVTVLTGVFAGYILKDKTWKPLKKLTYLIAIGILMIIIGWTWSTWHPVIKKIWTSSMVLVSSGYCFLLMALFYYFVDYKGWNKYLNWLKVYGMNSIVAYMLAMCVNFSCIAHSLFHGLEQYLGLYYQVLLSLSNAVLIYLILWTLYKKQLFLKV